MKVNSINSTFSVYRAGMQNKFSQNPISSVNNSQNDVFEKSAVLEQPLPKQVNFMGYHVHIVDGGRHAIDLEHFAESLTKDMEIITHKVRKLPYKSSLVDVKSLQSQLKYINDHKLTDKDAYVAIPAVVSVSLNKFKTEFQNVMDRNIYIKPDRVKSEKERMMAFLKKLYDDPSKYRKTIDNLDPEHQGIEFVYGVIQEINKLVCKNKYVPAEHGIYKSLKGMSEERNLKPELYNYIATGNDQYNHIRKLRDEIYNKGLYDFNLLGLSNAEVVNLKGPDKSNYIYSAYDMSVTDSERGVYNFSPVRENGKIVGYSFHDTKTKDYPFEEFPGNEEVAKIAKFVGLKAEEVVANETEIAAFLQAVRAGNDLGRYSNRIYPTHRVMTDADRWNAKADIRGDYVDSTFQLYFKKNNDGEIIFPNCDCEGSGRPSVMSMWGSCFSIFNVIKRNIDFENIHKIYVESKIDFHKIISNSLVAGKADEVQGNIQGAMNHYKKAIKQVYIKGFDSKAEFDLAPFLALADLKFNSGDLYGAEPLYNKVVNIKAKNLLQNFEIRKMGYDEYQGECIAIAKIFDKLEKICDKKGEIYSAQWCRRAISTLHNDDFGIRGKLLARRADNNLNIGDLFV